MVCGISIFASWVRSQRRRALSQLCLPARGRLHRFKRDVFALESFTYFLYISIGAPSIIGDSKRIKKTGSISNKCETPIMCGIYISADNRIQVLCLAANRQRLERMHNSAISCNMINLACKKNIFMTGVATLLMVEATSRCTYASGSVVYTLTYLAENKLVNMYGEHSRVSA